MRNYLNFLLIGMLVFVGCTIPSGYTKLESNPKFYKKYDEFKGITWYQHGYFFTISANATKPFQMYVGESKNDALNVARKNLEESLKNITDQAQREEIEKILQKSPSGGKYLRLNLVYSASDWIFFDNATLINQSGEKMVWSMKSYEKSKDVLSGGTVYESYDVLIGESDAKRLYDLLSVTGVAKLRLTGKYYKDYVIGTEYKTVLKNVIKFAYDFWYSF